MTGYEPVAATPPAWRFEELGQRAEFLDGQIERLEELAVTLATARAPSLRALHGVGPDTAAPTSSSILQLAVCTPCTPVLSGGVGFDLATAGQPG